MQFVCSPFHKSSLRVWLFPGRYWRRGFSGIANISSFSDALHWSFLSELRRRLMTKHLGRETNVKNLIFLLVSRFNLIRQMPTITHQKWTHLLLLSRILIRDPDHPKPKGFPTISTVCLQFAQHSIPTRKSCYRRAKQNHIDKFIFTQEKMMRNRWLKGRR